MEYSFACYGHENITAKHKTTLEFTKDTEMGLEGDCIVGVRADFDLASLKRFIDSLGNNREITIIIETINEECNNKNYNENNNFKKNIVEKINAEINPGFNSDKEMVIRKTDFVSGRTFAVNADMAALDLDRTLIAHLKAGQRLKIKITTKK
jgi:hypothetical protein